MVLFSKFGAIRRLLAAVVLVAAGGGAALAGIVGGPSELVAFMAGPQVVGPYPAPAVGHAVERVAPTNEEAPLSNVGAFRISCGVSHYAHDDPLVFPNQPGRSHLHTFFGATGVTASTLTNEELFTRNSTCTGGTLNRSAYWVPSMVDVRTGKVVPPNALMAYYKTGYNGIRPDQVRPIPKGFRMIAGSAANALPKGPFRFKCIRIDKTLDDNQMQGPAIPDCPVGKYLIQELFFPQCVAVDNITGEPLLDSPDHKSHVSYTVNRQCPSTHPYPIPEISFNVSFPAHKEAGALKFWRLSSDMYDPTLPGGYSSHGDYENGWDQLVFEMLTAYCITGSRDCHGHLIGGGRRIF